MGNKLLMSHCVFPTPDIKRTSKYYRKIMGFEAVEYLDARALLQVHSS